MPWGWDVALAAAPLPSVTWTIQAEAAGPEDFELVDLGGRAEAEMEAGVGGRGIAGAAEDVSPLANAASREEDLCADGVAGGAQNWCAARRRKAAATEEVAAGLSPCATGDWEE